MQHLNNDAKVDADGVHLAGMNYKVVILDGLTTLPDKVQPALQELSENGRLIIWKDSPFESKFPDAFIVHSSEELLTTVDILIQPDLILLPSSKNIRYRHVIKGGLHYYILFNEEDTPVSTKLSLSVEGKQWWLDEFTGEASKVQKGEPSAFQAHELKILIVE